MACSLDQLPQSMAMDAGPSTSSISSSSVLDGLESADNFSRFLVLGAGIAGLSAAAHFAKNGHHDFRVLEARNRLGGRIITFQIGGVKGELGASWIHGVLGNPLYELAVSNGLVDIVQSPKPHNVAAVTSDGRRLPFTVLQETYEAYYWFFRRCEEYFLCKYQPPEGVKSVGQHIELEISIYLQRFPPQQRYLRQLIFDYLLKRECCITGCDGMSDIDLLGIGSYTELPGGNITLPHGYASILNPILAHIPESRILKGHVVKHIHWMYRVEMENLRNDKGYESDGAESDCSAKTVKSTAAAEDVEESSRRGGPPLPAPPASPRPSSQSVSSSVQSSRAVSVCSTPLHQRSHPNVMVELESGAKFYADHVVCALPLGILKDTPDLFVPPLPAAKQDAMKMLNFGTVNKIYLEYERAFLSPEISEVILLWEKLEDESNVSMKDRWYRKIYSFSKAASSETVLVGWISGEEARYMETLKMNVVAETCTAILKKFLADPYVPKPKSCIFTAWYNQPYSRGSYTSIGVGGQQSHIEKLAEPLFQKPMNRSPALAFAGEHCHPSFYSTGHGAYLTGRSAAQFFINASKDQEEEVYNLGAASVADLSTWLEEVSMGEKNIEDFKSRTRGAKARSTATATRPPTKDDGRLVTPR